MTTEYNSSFFNHVADSASRSAAGIAQWLCGLAKPASVVDVGCANASWAAEFVKSGTPDVIGVDGDYVDRSMLLIPESCFHPADLTAPLQLDRRFDLAICLEVGEHIESSASQVLVETLARHSDVVLYSAALPYQGGTHHVNEQWPAYWRKLFNSYGFQLYDVIRPVFWDVDEMSWFYRQNIMLFIRGNSDYACRLRSAVEHLPSFDGLPLVHPSLWSRRHLEQRRLVGAEAGPCARLHGFSRAAFRALMKRFGP